MSKKSAKKAEATLVQIRQIIRITKEKQASNSIDARTFKSDAFDRISVMLSSKEEIA